MDPRTRCARDRRTRQQGGVLTAWTWPRPLLDTASGKRVAILAAPQRVSCSLTCVPSAETATSVQVFDRRLARLLES
jgi:hypothetical protein